jgi:hypothetical protein
MGHPDLPRIGVLKEIEQRGFVVSTEKANVLAFIAQSQEPIDDGAGLRPAVDIISQKQQRGRQIGVARVDADLVKEQVEQVGPAVHVADRIETLADGRLGRRAPEAKDARLAGRRAIDLPICPEGQRVQQFRLHLCSQDAQGQQELSQAPGVKTSVSF